jgi:hypothetical protein
VRTFDLIRIKDPSGMSGTGKVAEGIEFSNGRIALSWMTPRASVEIWNSIADLIYIHGHGDEQTSVIAWTKIK